MKKDKLITSIDNPLIKQIKRLKQKKYRYKEGYFLAEGERLVSDLLPTGLIKTVLIAASKKLPEDCFLSSQEQREEMAFQMVKVDDRVFKEVTDTVHNQGILALIAMPSYRLDELGQEDGLYLVLDRIQDPGNLGTIIRTAVAADVKAVLLVKGTVDLYNEKTIRSTMSGIGKLPIITDLTEENLIKWKEEKGLKAYATSLSQALPYKEVTYANKSLLIMGNEGQGVSRKLLAIADQKIQIPMYGPIESLNVSVASALCMFAIQERWHEHEQRNR